METLQAILAVIDNQGHHDVVQQALEASDTFVSRYRLTRSGEAQSALARAAYDCVLLDTDMPALVVDDVLCAVRKAHPQPAVVALVSAQPAPIMSGALAVEQYVPIATVTPAMLALSVRNAVRIRQAEEQQAAHTSQALGLLADVSCQLVSSEDHYVCLANTAKYIIEQFADWCAVDVMIETELTRVVLASRMPGSVRVNMFPSSETSRDAAAFFPSAMANTGAIQFYPDLSAVRRGGPTDLQFAMLGQARAGSLIRVPLCAREQTLGAVTFVRGDASARFTAMDRDLAEEIGRRVAMAVENELLYRMSQEAMRARDVFLSVAAHELKTPLTALLGYATLLKRRLEHGTQQPERDLRGVNIMVEQAKRLSKLLNTLLEISRMPHAPLNLEQSQCDLLQLTRRVTDELSPALHHHRFDVHMPDDAVVVDGDAARLELVLRNLLQNAVQYSPAGGVILVTLEHGDVEACLSIQDHGVGIPREALARIFGRFYRARDTSVHTATGMGVGLYIVKQIVESHGGYVDVQSVEGAGSTFRVCLPLHHPHEHANEVSI